MATCDPDDRLEDARTAANAAKAAEVEADELLAEATVISRLFKGHREQNHFSEKLFRVSHRRAT